MLIAKAKKKENIAEYILYIWQLEDLFRAYKRDEELIKKNIVEQFQVNKSEKIQIQNWYSNLLEMMKQEHIESKGHFVFIQNTIIDLNHLHLRLLQEPVYADYSQVYQNAKSSIELLKEKNAQDTNEIELCFIALYGLMTMRLKNTQISEDTKNALSFISLLVANLAKKYHQIEAGEIELIY
jgi:hypothetical protein